jgi:hypothetical protein
MMARFHQCQFGLRAPSGKFFKKKTVIMTNSPSIFAAFDQKLCCDDHPHQRIEGSEDAQRRSLLAQVYPDQMVNAIATAVMAEAAQATGF